MRAPTCPLEVVLRGVYVLDAREEAPDVKRLAEYLSLATGTVLNELLVLEGERLVRRDRDGEDRKVRWSPWDGPDVPLDFAVSAALRAIARNRYGDSQDGADRPVPTGGGS